MGSTAAVVSLDEYLNTTYEPDKEFVDGVLVERNMGTPPHGRLQVIVGSYFRQYRKSHRIVVFADARLQVRPQGDYRLPDVMVLEAPYRSGKAATDVPAVIVEIKSPDDTFDDIVDKCFEYEALGTPNILLMDPDNRRAFLFERGTLRYLEAGSVQLTLRSGALEFPYGEMFAELDEDLSQG
jgi:Uma2 family endonuclease